LDSNGFLDIPDRLLAFAGEQNSAQQRRIDYKIVTSGFYSEAEFTKSSNVFWPALPAALDVRPAWHSVFLVGRR